MSQDDLGKEVARRIFALFQGHLICSRKVSLSDGSGLKLLEARDCPAPGTSSWVTTNLSARRRIDRDGLDTRIELLAVSSGKDSRLLAVLILLAEMFVAEDEIFTHGMILPHLAAGVTPALPHILLSHPWDWSEYFQEVPTSAGTVYGLQIILLSDEELEFHQQFGLDALEIEFEEGNVSYWDLSRASLF